MFEQNFEEISDVLQPAEQSDNVFIHQDAVEAPDHSMNDTSEEIPVSNVRRNNVVKHCVLVVLQEIKTTLPKKNERSSTPRSCSSTK